MKHIASFMFFAIAVMITTSVFAQQNAPAGTGTGGVAVSGQTDNVIITFQNMGNLPTAGKARAHFYNKDPEYHNHSLDQLINLITEITYRLWGNKQVPYYSKTVTIYVSLGDVSSPAYPSNCYHAEKTVSDFGTTPVVFTASDFHYGNPLGTGGGNDDPIH